MRNYCRIIFDQKMTFHWRILAIESLSVIWFECSRGIIGLYYCSFNSRSSRAKKALLFLRFSIFVGHLFNNSTGISSFAQFFKWYSEEERFQWKRFLSLKFDDFQWICWMLVWNWMFRPRIRSLISMPMSDFQAMFEILEWEFVRW